MTLLITEVTNAGIVMIADSAISFLDSKGRIKEKDHQDWQKLFKIPSINAGLSYWGLIGKIPTKRNFDVWIKDVINDEHIYNNLEEFAAYVAFRLNDACGNKPLQDGEEVGIHISGYAEWDDEIIHPTLYHVHNGHGQYEGTPILRKGSNKIERIKVEWISQPRGLFEVHHELPMEKNTILKNLEELKKGLALRNGHFLLYAKMWEKFQDAIRYLNLIDGISIPRKKEDLRSRKGFLHVMVQNIIRLYECSNQGRIVGGTISSLGILPDKYIET